MILHETLPHTVNVLIHILFGTLALGAGLFQLLARKGGSGHRRRGRVFIWSVGIVVATAAIGILAYRSTAFLAVITLLVAYWSYSGMRALRIRETGPMFQDAAAAVCGLAAVGLFLLYIHSVRFPWVPSIIYSTLGTLATVATYDLLRFGFPRRWFASIWLYEHIVKMIGAHGAVVSAFAGTVLGAWQPYSQIIPSMVWSAAMVGYAVFYGLKRDRVVS